MFDDKGVFVQEPHCQIIVPLSHSVQSKVDKDQLPIKTVEGNELKFTLLLMEGGYLIPWTENLSTDQWVQNEVVGCILEVSSNGT